MTLDKMRNSIIKDAEKKAEEISGEASKESSEITDSAKREAAAISKRVAEEIKAEIERVNMEKRSDMENVVSSMKGAAEAEAVSNAVERVISRLAKVIGSMPGDKALKMAVSEMQKVAGDDIIIHANKRDASSLKGRYTIDYSRSAGFVIESKDGRIRLDATPEGIAEANRELAKTEVSISMFGSRGTHKAAAGTEGSKRRRKRTAHEGKMEHVRRRSGSTAAKKKR